MNFKDLLLEETDLTNVDNLLKALERGQISGVKRSDVRVSKNEKNDKSFFNFHLNQIKNNIPSIYRNAAVVLFLNKLSKADYQVPVDFIDQFLAYFFK